MYWIPSLFCTERSRSTQMWTVGSVTRTLWSPMGTGTVGTAQTVTSIMVFRRWVWKVCGPCVLFPSLGCQLSPFPLCEDLCLKTFCVVDVLCLQNGDYNKPIPAQYMEHLNHGVSGGLPTSEAPKTHQWVNCQMLLCRKCNNNQSLKIKKLASFIPRNEVRTVFLLQLSPFNCCPYPRQ